MESGDSVRKMSADYHSIPEDTCRLVELGLRPPSAPQGEPVPSALAVPVAGQADRAAGTLSVVIQVSAWSVVLARCDERPV